MITIGEVDEIILNWGRRFEFFISGFDYLVNYQYSDLFKLFLKMLMNDFIQLSDTFSKFGEEVIFDTVICSPWNAFSNVNPFITHIIMKFIKLQLFFIGPFWFDNSIKTTLISLFALFAISIVRLKLFIHFLGNLSPLP